MASTRAPPAADVAGAAASGRRDEAASFSSVWGGRGSEVGDEMSPRFRVCRAPRLLCLPKDCRTSEGVGEVSLAPTQQAPGSQAARGWEKTWSCILPIVYSAWLDLAYVKGRKSRFVVGQTCLGPTPNPLHFLAQASTSQGHSKEGTGFSKCDLPRQGELGGGSTRACGRLCRSGVAPPGVGGPGAGKAMVLALEDLSVFSFCMCPATISPLP